MLVGALASLPLNASRTELKEFLKKAWPDGPQPFGKVQPKAKAELKPTAPDATRSAAAGSRRGGKRDDDGPAAKTRSSSLEMTGSIPAPWSS
jgi:hypothetical protein